MYELDLAKLRKAMSIKVVCDAEGKDCKLISSITLKDPKTGRHKTFSREADLAELINEIIRGIRHRLGEDQHHTHVSGWLSEHYHRARDIARRVAEDKTTQMLYKDVLPEVAPYIPGAPQAIDIAHKAHQIVVMARQGDREAHAKIAAVSQMARDGHPQAGHVVNIMKHIATLIRQKEGYMRHERVAGEEDEVAGWFYNKPFRDPVTARNLDFTDPFNAARYLYGRALTER